MIDDVQVQPLAIAWIDVPTDGLIELEIRVRPDEFMLGSTALVATNRFVS